MLSATPTTTTRLTEQKHRGVKETPAAVLALTTDPETRDLLLEMAVADGFGLRCAGSPSEALAILGLERPGLLLVDLDLPERAGPAFLRAIRQGPHRDIHCLAITATNDPMLAVSCDATVFFKPTLDGIEAAVAHLFWPDDPSAP
jgi:CheY-like chemotaxis protein